MTCDRSTRGSAFGQYEPGAPPTSGPCDREGRPLLSPEAAAYERLIAARAAFAQEAFSAYVDRSAESGDGEPAAWLTDEQISLTLTAQSDGSGLRPGSFESAGHFEADAGVFVSRLGACLTYGSGLDGQGGFTRGLLYLSEAAASEAFEGFRRSLETLYAESLARGSAPLGERDSGWYFTEPAAEAAAREAFRAHAQ